MVGNGIAQSRMGKLRAFEEEKRKLADLAQTTNPVPDKLAYQDRPKALQEQQPSVSAAANTESPALDKMTWKNTGIVPMAGQGEYRTEALRDMNEQEFAQNQAKMNASEKEYWVEQAKANPTSTYANLKSYLASSETPEEKAKRERRERLGEVFNNLGNLIGNAANLYYTSKGGQYIDVNAANEKHRARMDAIKAKQDALKQRQDELLMQYKVADIQAAREAAAKKEEREYNAKVAQKKIDADAKAKELEYKRDIALKQIDNALKMGQIDAQTAANMKRDAAKAQSAKELEAIKQANRIELKTTPNGNESVRTSFSMPNGDIYTRDTDLDDIEAMTLAKYMKDMSPYMRTDSDGKEYRDYKRAAVDAVNSGSVPADVLTRMGYKKSKDSGSKGSSLGIGIGNNKNSGNKL